MRLMNNGTKIRTFCLIIVLANQANINLGQVNFGNEAVNTVYRIVSYLLTLAAAIAAWYYNNDTSEEGAIGTGVTRQLKAERGDEYYVGDYFYTEEDVEEVEKEEADEQ